MTIPILIVAAVIRDTRGRVLLVRKRGTTKFMQPGGKVEPAEDRLAALDRELGEELGCSIMSESVRYLGKFRAPSANEPGHHVEASLYEVEIAGEPKPQAEIDEIMWLHRSEHGNIDLAPLTRDFVLPLLD